MNQCLIHLLTKPQPRRASWRSMSRVLPPIPQIFTLGGVMHDVMHGQGVSSLRLGTLEPTPHSPPHQASTKESKMENHKPSTSAHSHMALSWHDAWARCGSLFEAWHPWTMASFMIHLLTKLQPRQGGEAQEQDGRAPSLVPWPLDERSHPLFTFMVFMPKQVKLSKAGVVCDN